MLVRTCSQQTQLSNRNAGVFGFLSLRTMSVQVSKFHIAGNVAVKPNKQRGFMFHRLDQFVIFQV